MTIIISRGVQSGNVSYNGLVEVLQGGSVASLTLLPGGTAQIAGVVGAATVSSGAAVSVTNGGAVSRATILSGGTQSVFGGGIASQTVVQGGGSETVASGANTISGLVSGGGTEVFIAGAQLLHETVLAGGTLAESGLSLATSMTLVAPASSETLNIVGSQLTGVAETIGATIVAGGVLSVTANTTDSGTTVARGGQLVDAGGTVLGDTVDLGGTMTVSSGTVSGTTVAGQLNVVSGGATSGSVISGVGAIESGTGLVLRTMFSTIYETFLTGDTVEAGGQIVMQGAYAHLTDVASGGTAMVDNNGLLSGATVNASGLVDVLAGGSAVGTNVSSGGVVYLSGGSDYNATVLNGGNEVIFSGGISITTTLDAGGNQGVLTSGQSDSASVLAGGVLGFDVGATVTSATIAIGGTLSEQGVVLTAGMAMTDAGIGAPETFSVAGIQATAGIVETVFTSIGNAATLTVASGGTDLSGTVGAGGLLVVQNGGLASGTTVSGGELTVSGGGHVVNAVLDGGSMVVSQGFISGATVTAGSLTISQGGVDMSATVSGGGREVVSGQAKYDTVSGGGVAIVANGGSDLNATIMNGGSMTVDAGGRVGQLTVDSGGSASLLSGAQAQGSATIDGGTLETAGQGGGFPVVDFAGPGGVFIDNLTVNGLQTAFSGFVAGDTIDLANLAFVSAATISPTNQFFNVAQGGGVVRLNFGQIVTGDQFFLSKDGGSGTDVTLQAAVLCFREGTRIATPGGEVAVEHLRPGDAVSLASGGVAPVAWLGRRAVDIARHPRPETVRPVRVRADAFGPGLPARDLWLSPDHAVYVDGVLIPVRYLIDGASIARDTAATRATYWHIELAAHDVVLAEGLPCESYLDAGNRDAFDNAGAVTRLHPDFAQRLWDAAACAPLVVAGPRLDEARARLRRLAASRRARQAGRRGAAG